MILKDYIKLNTNYIINQKTKTCIECKKRKSVLQYDVRNDTKKILNRCHKCVSNQKMLWKKNNRDKVLISSKKRYAKYKKEICYRMSPEFLKKEGKLDVLKRKHERGKKHYQKNKHYYSVKSAKQRALRKKQTFPSGVECKEILKIYKERNKLNKKFGFNKYSVDHIIPLVNKNVCGLHTAINLKIVLTKLNLSKANKFIPNLPSYIYGTKKYYNLLNSKKYIIQN